MSAESSKENLGAISVKLLKRLLDAKKISYDDCLEKTQLIQRVLDSGALATDVDLDALKLTLKRHAGWKKVADYHKTAASHLIYFHSSYRASCDTLIDFVKKLDVNDKNFAKNLDKLNTKFTQTNQYLHAHHSIEENYMFPRMNARFGTKIDGLADQHEEMRQLEENVFGWIQQLKKTPSQEALMGLKLEMEAFLDVLLSHLNEEEEYTIPDLFKIRGFEQL